MPKNEFLPFGTAANANVLPNADYQALPARSSGFNSGVAKSEQLNTVWRQASVIASVVAQFIVDNTGKDVLDDGDLSGLQDKLKESLLSFSTGRLIRTLTFTSNATYTPSSGAKRIFVRVWAGGGGGSGTYTSEQGGFGGGGGGFASGYIDVASVTSLPVVVGAGGTGVAAGASGDGGNGGSSSVGGISCTGGRGGSSQNKTPGAGGVGSGGSIENTVSQQGQGFVNNIGGNGGSSRESFGGIAGESPNGGIPGGGAAGATTGFRGGEGGRGFVIIEEYS
ncbi:glycine-rich domain-containing protein [Serratia sarumanii]|uniref:glycine-rich domain-containing protein n=2 Tax=Serratia sarumanii TaxID=3020826 RepID=UPI003F7F4776